MTQNFDKLNIENEEVGFCLVPRKQINTTSISNNSETEICVYVPKLMSEIEMEDKPYIRQINNISSSMVLNDDIPLIFPQTVKICNFIRCEPLNVSNISTAYLAPAERCNISFKDCDIKKPFYTDTYTQTEKRETDAHQITVPGEETDYIFSMDTINQKVELIVNDKINILLDEKLKELKINMEQSVIQLTSATLKIILDQVIVNGNVNINGNVNTNGTTKTTSLYVGGEEIKSLIRRIASEVCSSLCP
jgi:hypothetical protein